MTHQITSLEQLERAEEALRQEGYGEPDPAMSEERFVIGGKWWAAAVLGCAVFWAAVIGGLFMLIV